MKRIAPKTIEKIIAEECTAMNTPEHGKYAAQDYNGNTGDYRLATHDGADYAYLSDWYGQAMCTVRPEWYEEFGLTTPEGLAHVLGLPVDEVIRRAKEVRR